MLHKIAGIEIKILKNIIQENIKNLLINNTKKSNMYWLKLSNYEQIYMQTINRINSPS